MSRDNVGLLVFSLLIAGTLIVILGWGAAKSLKSIPPFVPPSDSPTERRSEIPGQPTTQETRSRREHFPFDPPLRPPLPSAALPSLRPPTAARPAPPPPDRGRYLVDGPPPANGQSSDHPNCAGVDDYHGRAHRGALRDTSG